MTTSENPIATDKPEGLPEIQDEPESRPGGIPLYVWVIAAVLVAIPVGRVWGEGATSLELLPKLILRALTALAAPLVVLAILSAIVTNEIRGRLGGLMMVFYLINTLVAMMIGLTLTNLIRPGSGRRSAGQAAAQPPPPEIDLRAPHRPDPPQHRRAVHPEPPGAARRPDAGAGHRPGENPRRAEGPGRTVVPGRRRPADDRLRAADEGAALGGGPRRRWRSSGSWRRPSARRRR